MAANPQEIKKYQANGREQVDEGLPGWFVKVRRGLKGLTTIQIIRKIMEIKK